MGVQGRSALVTGAASGIGEGVARALADGGARVCLVDLDRDGLERVAAEIASGGGEALPVVADVTDGAAVERAVASASGAHDGLDVLVNNAGAIAPERAIDELEETRLERVLAVNLKAQFICCAAAARVMKPAGYGRIVNVASRSWLGGAGIADYAAAKAGVLGLTRSLALELGRFGITVNALSPSLIITPLFRAMPAAEQAADLEKAKRFPVGRIGQVEDMAHAVLAFAADEAGFLTGQHLYVSGGADLLTSGPGW